MEPDRVGCQTRTARHFPQGDVFGVLVVEQVQRDADELVARGELGFGPKHPTSVLVRRRPVD